jgi:hypothetical protein
MRGDSFPLHNDVVEIICNKYSVLVFVNLVDYDLDPESLASLLEKYHSHSFSSNEKIVVLHHDTDYYVSTNAVGNTVYNFFRLCANFDISLDNIIFLTNHYGIDEEIKKVSMNICNSSNVSVIYTSLWYDFPTVAETLDKSFLFEPEKICKLYSCLNGQQRMHRMLTLCMLEHADLLDQGIISYHFG